MPGLVGAVARTAVAAGTWTAVSNRVARRQSKRWAEKDQRQYSSQPAYGMPAGYAPAQQPGPPPPGYAQQPAYPPQYAPAPQYAAPPPQYAPAPGPAPAAAPAAAAEPAGGAVPIERIRQLGELHQQGILTDEEFAAAKAKLLGP